MLKNSEFCRLITDRPRRCPIPGIALVSDATYIEVTVDTTKINLIDSIGSSQDFTYENKTVDEVVSNINNSGFDIKAYKMCNKGELKSGDFISFSSKQFGQQTSFEHVDQIKNGCLLRLKDYGHKLPKKFHFQLLSPYNTGPLMPWYPRFEVGNLTLIYKGNQYVFSVPEYYTQPFSVKYGAPYVDIEGEVPTSIDGKVIRLARRPIYWNENNIQIYSGNTPISQDVIKDVDIYNGIIYLKDDVRIPNPLVFYTYVEKTYEYKHLNVNCHIDQQPDLLDKVVIFYLTPSESPIPTNYEHTINHIVGSSIEGAINNIPYDDPNVPIYVLGAYIIKQPKTANSVTFMDTRTLGGGLYGPRKSPTEYMWSKLENKKERERAEILEKSYWHSKDLTDIGTWDGVPAPSNSCILVGLPENIKGMMSVDELRKKVESNVAMGTYPVIDYYSTTGEFL